MKVLFVRHGIAEDRELYFTKGLSDELRPLTQKGRKQLKKMGLWLKDRNIEIDEIWTSPLVRAQQTTEVLSQVYSCAKVFEKDELKTTKPHRLDSSISSSVFNFP